MNITDLNFKGINLYKDFPVITSKTNSGKTTFAIKELKNIIETITGDKITKVILLTPYKRTRKQLLQDKRFIGKINDLGNALEPDAVNVATYAKASLTIQEGKIDLRGSLLIFDELPTFIQFTKYQKQLSYLVEFLLDEKLFQSCVCIGLTGTPAILFNYCNKCNLPFIFKDLTPQTELNITAEQGLFVAGGSAITYAKRQIQKGLSGAKLYYVQGAKQAITISRLFNNAGYSSAFIVSEFNETIDKETKLSYCEMMEQQIYDGESITEWIDSKSDIPPQLDVLIINSAVRDGLNILDAQNRIDEVVIQSECRMTIEQARARVRHNIKYLTVIYSHENEQRALNDLNSAIQYFRNSAQNLEERFFEQNKAENDLELWKVRRNNAILNDEKFSESKPKQLDLIVMSGKQGLFINPFIMPLLLYELDNYTFSNEYDSELNEYIDYYRFGKRIHTFQEFKQSLEPLLDGRQFRIISNSDIAVDVVNATRINRDSISSLLGISEGSEKTFTVDELRELAKQFQPINKDYKKRSVPTLLKELEQYCEIKKYTPTINGKRRTAYKIKM